MTDPSFFANASGGQRSLAGDSGQMTADRKQMIAC